MTSPMVAWVAIRSKVVALLLLIYRLMYFPLSVGVLCLSLFWYGLLCVLSSFAFMVIWLQMTGAKSRLLLHPNTQ